METPDAALAEANRKLDRILSVVEKLEPHLPLLEQLVATMNNPAARFLLKTKR
jgi:hypothetical protein